MATGPTGRVSETPETRTQRTKRPLNLPVNNILAYLEKRRQGADAKALPLQAPSISSAKQTATQTPPATPQAAPQALQDLVPKVLSVTETPITRKDFHQLQQQAREGLKLEAYHILKSLEEKATALLEPYKAQLPAKAYGLALLIYSYGLYDFYKRQDRFKVMPSQHTFHLPQDIFQTALGWHSRHTMQRYRQALEDLQLIAQQDHYTHTYGKDRCTGKLWVIKLADTQGKPKFTLADFKYQWRDMYQAQKTGHTAYNFKNAHTDKGLKILSNQLKLILDWSLSPLLTNSSVAMYVHFGIESVLDVLHVPWRKRRSAVQIAAKAVCQALNDESSFKLYLKLIWNALKLEVTGQQALNGLYHTVRRAQIAFQEGTARHASKYFIALLKEKGFYQQLMQAPEVRVCYGL